MYSWTLQWEGWVTNRLKLWPTLSCLVTVCTLYTVGFSLLVFFFNHVCVFLVRLCFFLMSVFLWHGNTWRRLEDSLLKLALYFLIDSGDRTQIINLGCKCPWFIILLVLSSWIYCVLSNKQIHKTDLWTDSYIGQSIEMLYGWGFLVDSIHYYILLRVLIY